MKKFKANNMLFPMPVLLIATYNEDNSVNVMNAAWGTMEDMDVILIELTHDHKTSLNIKEKKPSLSLLRIKTMSFLLTMLALSPVTKKKRNLKKPVGQPLSQKQLMLQSSTNYLSLWNVN